MNEKIIFWIQNKYGIYPNRGDSMKIVIGENIIEFVRTPLKLEPSGYINIIRIYDLLEVLILEMKLQEYDISELHESISNLLYNRGQFENNIDLNINTKICIRGFYEINYCCYLEFHVYNGDYKQINRLELYFTTKTLNDFNEKLFFYFLVDLY